VLVQVVDELGDPALEASRDRDVVEHRQVLYQLAQSHPAGVRAHGNVELLRHQVDGEDLIHAAEPGGVELAVVEGSRLKHLLEQHPVHAVLARGHADRRDGSTDGRMP